MSTQYKSTKDVPTETLVGRLNELSDAITRGRQSLHDEFTMRIPAECDHDADLVLAESAVRLDRMRLQLAKSEARVAQMHEAAHDLYAWCVENLTAEQIKEGFPAGHKIGQLLEFERPAVESFVARKQAEAVERAKQEHALTARVPDGTVGEHFQDGFDTAAEQYDTSLDRYAQRLRQQADEAERAGGEM